MKRTGYTKPQINTYEGTQIVESLGPVSAGSGKLSIETCGGSSLGPNPCP